MDANAEQIAEIFEIAADENRLDSLRRHQVVTLPDHGVLFVVGDVHDHRRNFEKLLRLADLAHHPDHHIVLQELIHGEHYDERGGEDSWRILLQAAKLKADFSSQVHFILSNHDLAQIQGEGLLKNGCGVCEAFNKGVKHAFGGHAGTVTVAITELLLSFPLAVRTPGGLFCCHSIPCEAQVAGFDYAVFDRDPAGPDYVRKTGAVYQLVWGRGASPTAAELFVQRVGASMIVTGHQAQDAGFGANGDKHLILASDHNHGVFLQTDLGQSYDMPGLLRGVKKFVGVE